jgi:hypothetical protein
VFDLQVIDDMIAQAIQQILFAFMYEQKNVVIHFHVKQVSEASSSVTTEKAVCKEILSQVTSRLYVKALGSDRHM